MIFFTISVRTPKGRLHAAVGLALPTGTRACSRSLAWPPHDPVRTTRWCGSPWGSWGLAIRSTCGGCRITRHTARWLGCARRPAATRRQGQHGAQHPRHRLGWMYFCEANSRDAVTQRREIEWARDFMAAMRPWSVDQAPPSFLEPDEGDARLRHLRPKQRLHPKRKHPSEHPRARPIIIRRRYRPGARAPSAISGSSLGTARRKRATVSRISALASP